MLTIWNPWFVQKPTFPSKTIAHNRLTKGERERERERERVLFKTSTIHWYPRDYLIIFIIIYWGTNGKILKES
jgi:hypothetical protein